MRFLGSFLIATFLLTALSAKGIAGTARLPLSMESMPQSWEAPGCQVPLIIEIAGIKLSVPRHQTVLKLNSGQTKYTDLESCDTHFIGNVHSASVAA